MKLAELGGLREKPPAVTQAGPLSRGVVVQIRPGFGRACRSWVLPVGTPGTSPPVQAAPARHGQSPSRPVPEAQSSEWFPAQSAVPDAAPGRQRKDR